MPRGRVAFPRHTVTQPSDQSYRLIPLTQGQNAIVDAEDFEWLSRWYWHAIWDQRMRTFYAVRFDKAKGKIVRMHREIIKCSPTQQVDHRSHNTLDNRKNNLRACTEAQNSQNRKINKTNSSGRKGVCWHKTVKKWICSIRVEGRLKYLGHFDSPDEAGRAYDKAASIYFGEFALLNFPLLDDHTQ